MNTLPPSMSLRDKFAQFLGDPEVSAILTDLRNSYESGSQPWVFPEQWMAMDRYARQAGYAAFHDALLAIPGRIEMAMQEFAMRQEKPSGDAGDETDLSVRLTY